MAVLETVNTLGMGSPFDILKSVAIRSNADPEEPNFKRNVYRDLSDLADQGRISVQYFGAGGEEITEYSSESHRNVRVQYSSLKLKAGRSVPGAGILQQIGAQFIPSHMQTIEWSFHDSRTFTTAGRYTILIPGLASELVALQFPEREVPVKILIGRTMLDRPENRAVPDEIKNTHGHRTAALLIADRAVSRLHLPVKPGHCVLTFTPGGFLVVEDLASSMGTFSGLMSEDDVQTMIRELKGSDLLTTRPQGFGVKPGAELKTKIMGATGSLTLPQFVWVGGVRLAVLGPR